MMIHLSSTFVQNFWDKACTIHSCKSTKLQILDFHNVIKICGQVIFLQLTTPQAPFLVQDILRQQDYLTPHAFEVNQSSTAVTGRLCDASSHRQITTMLITLHKFNIFCASIMFPSTIWLSVKSSSTIPSMPFLIQLIADICQMLILT